METQKIGPGPKVGRILNHLLERVLDDPSLNKRGVLIDLVKKYEE